MVGRGGRSPNVGVKAFLFWPKTGEIFTARNGFLSKSLSGGEEGGDGEGSLREFSLGRERSHGPWQEFISIDTRL